jgi:dolichol-phosphate mannosyltransferase
VKLIDSPQKTTLLKTVMKHRFPKFAVVGFSGTLVNLAVLYACQEILLRSVSPEQRRLNLSLGAAIFLATINNYLWNRYWTWRDRKGRTKYGFFVQMGQYFLASWLSIVLQFVLTKLAAVWVHYLVANVIAIAFAAIVTYLLNDTWTFATRKPSSR